MFIHAAALGLAVPFVGLALPRADTAGRWRPGVLGGQRQGDGRELEAGGGTNATPHGPQVAGMRYLHGVLGPIINRVFEEKKYVELDPSKVEVKDVG